MDRAQKQRFVLSALAAIVASQSEAFNEVYSM